ncbi:N-acetylglutaminylglutamine synthetase [Pseudovibrio exalbescens]|uniref:N-acetylglutaminylglutamine synthetase n=1 Tax=Pseudovibrio exalbescens TaxID=197461 RepID=UPI0023668BC5|nr:N-acetylglutaminylglutamine synthetase [Pseudovibrio exalbescens]MDD7911462.1 N-acetylglutaminylglutamine synthetase [Pseudovibrio exalbescens]
MADQVNHRLKAAYDHRLRRMRDNAMPHELREGEEQTLENVSVDCGWGSLILGSTFMEPEPLLETIRQERRDRRDIAFYVRDPHVLIASAPQELFLDPSHTYRLMLATYRAGRNRRRGFTIRRLSSREDAEALNVLYAARGMVTIPPDFFWDAMDPKVLAVLVAEDDDTGEIIGTAMGVDHNRATKGGDPGSSLWCLSVSPQARPAGVGEELVRRLAELFQARGNPHMDLSVMHDNDKAISLYEKLGFTRVPFFAVKHKNPINESLFIGKTKGHGLNPYGAIIVNEASRRGIHTEIIDAEGGFFSLTHGGRTIRCRESLSEITSAVALSICDDKTVTRRLVEQVGIHVPERLGSEDNEAIEEFLTRHRAAVVKPASGEQGKGVSVGLTTLDEVNAAIETARQYCSDVLIEEFVEGQDLRLIVIDYRVVAAAVRRPAEVTGDGRSSIKELITAQSRRRSAATGGESQIPIDEETERCLSAAGYTLESVPDAGQSLFVRRTANLHTGGTIHDVTGETNRELINAAIEAAKAIGIPVTGIDLMVKSPREPEYRFIEANERPGLANHEPQPTAEKFIDFLFPLTKTSIETAHQARDT